jgi:hypothetical protein
MSRLFRTRVRRYALVGAVVVLGVSAALLSVEGSAVASPQATGPTNLSHFLCYMATPTKGYKIPGNVILENQFNTKGFSPTISQEPLIHCNPVKKTVVSAAGTKTVYPIVNANAHLLCYPITAPTQTTYTVSVTNQFGTADLNTGQPEDLCLPTWKSLTGPPRKSPNEPPGLSHFTCYPVTYVPGTAPFQPPPSIKLKDEFSPANVSVQVGSPELLCLPTTKIVNGVVYKAIDPKSHLLCFEVSQTPTITPVFDQNQFGTDQVNIQQTSLLCLPSFKKIIS